MKMTAVAEGEELRMRGEKLDREQQDEEQRHEEPRAREEVEPRPPIVWPRAEDEARGQKEEARVPGRGRTARAAEGAPREGGAG